ncbi:DUF2087 domain-containing protein [Liquorilactobacillus capillatus]|nr:DUF2087 domain-containing protein [Liquorilactobacillus capillatus]
METNLDINLKLNKFENGYTFKNSLYSCLYCNTIFYEGEVYPIKNRFFTAHKMIQDHIQEKHGGPLLALLNSPNANLGVSKAQKQVLQLFAQGLQDNIIAKRLGLSTSTIRNYRFKLRERKRQAYQLLAALNILDLTSDAIQPHIGAKMLDDRYAISSVERDKVLKNYLNEEGHVTNWPSKEKNKIIILNELVKKFDPAKNYSEKIVNEILKKYVDDFVTVRRYLIEYGFLSRKDDGSSYWVTLSSETK